MNEAEFKPAVIYARVSSKKQVKEGGGIESQATRCRSYASSKGYDVVAMFTDDMTGSKARRPGMDAMLSYLKQNRKAPHVVLIDDISRLARGLEAHLKLRDELSKAGGILESPSVVFGDDSDSQFLENVLASSAQHFAQKNREQTINRMKSRLLNGYYVNSIPPAGYKYIKGHGKVLVKDEPLASIVTEALEGYASGRFSTKGELRQFLQDQPEFAKPRSGEITHDRVNVLLTQKLYAGLIEAPAWGVSERQGKHEALISYETYLKIQKKHEQGKPVRSDVNAQNDFALKGAVNCGDCDGTLTACWSKGRTKKYPYYHCFNKSCESYKKSISRDKMESEFETFLERLEPSQTLFKVASRMFKDWWDYRAATNQERTSSLRADLTRLETQMVKLVDKMIDTDNDLVTVQLENRLAQMEQNKRVIAEKIEKLGKPVRGYNEMFEPALTFLANPYKIWKNGTYEDRRNVLKLAFTERLQYSRKTGLRTPKTAIPFKVLGGVMGGLNEMAHRGGFEPPTP